VSFSPDAPRRSQLLRDEAEGRLKSGLAPAANGWTISPETLSLLYRLASDPDSSADALKLLHELQTHQVELDLQHAQLEENESELNAQLAHYQTLYDMAPAGYLVLDRDGRILHSNQAADRLFGVEIGGLQDHSLASMLSPESRPALMALFKSPEQSTGEHIVHVKALDSRPFRLVSDLAPQADAILLLIFPEDMTPGG